jgi:leucyl aminopeptidase
LVGKGITFDSGGISIKPGQGMELMKYDKSGACAVIATMVAVARLGLPLHVVGIAALAENMPSGKAYRPGDIVTMANGKTVEILNTDAEGRMVLGDALWYAERAKPDAIIDLATLTGAVEIALGRHYTGLMANDQDLADRLRTAGERSGERLWQLPIGDEYQEQIKGTHADLVNIGGRPGGALTAGQFLSNFVDGKAWAHLDIAATAWVESDGAYTPKGVTGVGVRAMTTFLRGLVE